MNEHILKKPQGEIFGKPEISVTEEHQKIRVLCQDVLTRYVPVSRSLSSVAFSI
jgi:hypothetical protein